VWIQEVAKWDCASRGTFGCAAGGGRRPGDGITGYVTRRVHTELLQLMTSIPTYLSKKAYILERREYFLRS
jgi:hypothetical protein